MDSIETNVIVVKAIGAFRKLMLQHMYHIATLEKNQVHSVVVIMYANDSLVGASSPLLHVFFACRLETLACQEI